MGNVKITSLPKIREYQRDFAYADLHLDLVTSYTSRSEVYAAEENLDVKIDYDLGAIRNSIINIMTTSPGEKILNPLLGIDLRDLLFEPVSEDVRETIVERIQTGLVEQEPRVEFFEPPEVISDEENEQYTVNLKLIVPLLDEENIIGLTGLLNFDGFSILNN